MRLLKQLTESECIQIANIVCPIHNWDLVNHCEGANRFVVYCSNKDYPLGNGVISQTNTANVVISYAIVQGSPYVRYFEDIKLARLNEMSFSKYFELCQYLISIGVKI